MEDDYVGILTCQAPKDLFQLQTDEWIFEICIDFN